MSHAAGNLAKQRAVDALAYALKLEVSEVEGRDWRIVRDAFLVAADAAEEAGCSEDGPAKSGAREMVRRCRGKVFPLEHVHACPVCYAHAICRWTCSEAPDLGFDEATGLPFGDHAWCEECEESPELANMVPLKLPGCVTVGNRRSWATLSECGRYRYALGRTWDQKGEREAILSIVMLNPSTADHAVDDPTIRRCIHFAKQEGCGGLLVRNLFAWRATDPKELRSASDPIGSQNWEAMRFASKFEICVAAWGAMGSKRLRKARQTQLPEADEMVDHVKRLIRPLHVFGLTKHGQPRHPLYLPNAARAVPWTEAVESAP